MDDMEQLSELKRRTFTAMCEKIEKGSKWETEDRRAAYECAMKKDRQGCLDTLARLNVRVSQAEIRKNCQFEGLPKGGK